MCHKESKNLEKYNKKLINLWPKWEISMYIIQLGQKFSTDTEESNDNM